MEYRVVEHTADVALELRGGSLEGLLAAATAGVRFLHAGRKRPREEHRVSVRVEGGSPEELLVKWVNELIYFFDTRGELALEAADLRVDDERGALTAAADLSLCSIDRAGFVPRAVLKSATYHGLEVTTDAKGYLRATLVIDT